METDILLQAKNAAKKKHTTMYEVNDSSNNRTCEFSGSGYETSFIGFLESLGYDVVKPHKTLSGITINGAEFYLYDNNASYMSRNGWTREETVRKPENRFMAITKTSHSDDFILKVHINKELYADKIKAKIDKAVADYFDLQQSYVDKKLQTNANILAVGNHYAASTLVKENVEHILVQKGEITFRLKKDIGYLVIKSTGELVSATLNPKVMKSIEELDLYANGGGMQTWILREVTSIVTHSHQLPQHLIDWAKDTYNGYFYTSTMSTER